MTSPEKRRGGPGSSRAATATPVAKRLVLVAMALFTAWHLFASFLWIAPASPVREVLPQGLLRSYMMPMFGQSWSVFAPSPIRSDFHLEVRAAVDEGGDELTTTPWTRATLSELSRVQHNLFPPRSAEIGFNVAMQLYEAYADLSEQAREDVGASRVEDDWLHRLEGELSEDPDGRAYLAAERKAVAYATQVAYAVWGDDVVRVQVRVSSDPVRAFDKRNEARTPKPEPVVRTPGWRGTLEYDGQSREQFRDYFCSAPIGLCP
ncbi:DUF5819 family protein [Microbacterium sp. NPDC096154]|uniref:DUF5819 family protein n=1 Tax=Microbacterium sp. NPDC096154 TaxID=3155549 RepID=UPI0033327DFB